MQHVVVGAGQIGRAIAEVLGPDVALVDLPERDKEGKADYLHICFPFSSNFILEVRRYQKVYEPAVTIIHSTVPVGTSREVRAVHSPVIGRHPHLAESIRTFVKFFGGRDAWLAADPFIEAGVTVQIVTAPETTELGKLWSTLQFGFLVALQKEAYRLAKIVGADAGVAYEDFNTVYSQGYAELGESFRLPIIRDMQGPIGGHCIMPNTILTPGLLPSVLRQLNTQWGEESDGDR